MGNYPHPLPPRLPPSANRKNNLFYPTPPSSWEVFRRNPLLYVAQWLYKHQPPLSPPLTKSSRSIKIVCISDTHNEEPKIPDGDVLVHAGDLTNLGFFAEIQTQLNWLNSLPHEHKIVIAGNHDRLLDNDYGTRHPNLKWREPDTDPRGRHDLNWGNIIYLEKTSVSLSIRGQTINVYGSPMTPQYGNSGFQYLRHDNIWSKAVPSSTDIVVTHGPARGHLDLEGHGCVHLNRELWRTKPRLHVCGHLHAGRGVQYVDWGWFQALYDAVCRDRKGFWRTIGMMVLWVWMWIRFVVLGRRASRTVFANVAIQGERGMNEATVVDL